MTTLANRLALLRERSGLTLYDVARNSGLSYTVIQQIETGEIPNPAITTLANLALGLGVPISALMGVVDVEDVPDRRQMCESLRDLANSLEEDPNRAQLLSILADIMESDNRLWVEILRRNQLVTKQ